MSPVTTPASEFEAAGFDVDAFQTTWLLALAAYGVGDVVTTIALVWFSPLHAEANPLLALAIERFGALGLVGLKLLAFYVALGASVWVGLDDEDPLSFYGPPLVLFGVGVVVTCYNLGLLLG